MNENNPEKIILAVLLAEDVDADAELISCDVMRALPQSQITVTRTAEETYRAVDEGDFELVLLDLGLPDNVGSALVREVRRRTQVPIVIVTGDSSNDMANLCIEAGADSYMVKGHHDIKDIQRILAMAVGRRERDVLQPLRQRQRELNDNTAITNRCLVETEETIRRIRLCLALSDGRTHQT